MSRDFIVMASSLFDFFQTPRAMQITALQGREKYMFNTNIYNSKALDNNWDTPSISGSTNCAVWFQGGPQGAIWI